MTQRANIQTTAVKALENSAVAFAGSEKKWAFAFFFEAEQLWKNARLYDAVAKSASRAYFINADLLWPQHAPWVQVLGARNDMAYINLFRLDVDTFDYLYAQVDPDWIAWLDGWEDHTRTVGRPGPVNRLNARAHIGLALAYLATTSPAKMFQMMFGAGPSIVSRTLRAGLKYLLLALEALPETDVSWPSINGQRRFSDAIDARYGPPPAVFRGIINALRLFAFLDGLRLQSQNPSDVEDQEFFYNGCVGYTNTNHIFAWAPNGKAIAALINYPGSLHDYRCTQPVFDKLHNTRMTLPGNVMAADTAFASRATDDVCATASSYQPPAGLNHMAVAAAQPATAKWIFVIRKGAEWGMRTMQALWPRITVPMSPNQDANAKMIITALRLTNLIADRMDSHSQLKSVYFDPMMRAPWVVNHG